MKHARNKRWFYLAPVAVAPAARDPSLADGHGRKPSESALYFCDKKGNVKMLPREMKEDFAKPKAVR